MVWDYMVFVKTASSFSRLLNGFLYMFISYACYIDIKNKPWFLTLVKQIYTAISSHQNNISSILKWLLNNILNSFINDISRFKLQINGFTDHCKAKCVSFNDAY